jgi:hypothetical protein
LSGTGGNLSLAAQGSGVNLSSASNAIVNAAGIATGNFTTAFNLVDGVSLNVNGSGSIDGVSGISATNATNSGIVLASSANNNALSLFQPVSATNGNITFTFDNMALNVGGAGGVNAGTKTVILQPFNTARPITLGTKPGGTLGLIAADFDAITAGVLQIGILADSAGITISSAVARHAGYPTLSLVTGSTVGQTAELSAANLAIRAGDTVTLTDVDNNIDTLAGNVSGSGHSFSFTVVNNLTIGSVDGINGITTADGNLTVHTTAGDLTVNQTVAALLINSVELEAGSTGASPNHILTNNSVITGSQITLLADRMALSGSVNSSIASLLGGNVILEPLVSTRNIDLGSTLDTTANTLELSNAELNTISGASAIVPGSGNNVTVSQALSIPTAVANALLISVFGGISNVNSTASITVTNLALNAGNAVSLTAANQVSGNLAAAVANAGQGFTFTSAASLRIGSAAGFDGITTHAGSITITQTSGNVIVGTAGPVAPIIATGGGSVFITTPGANNITVNQKIDTTPGNGGLVMTGANVTPQGPNALYVAGGGDIFLNASITGVLTSTASNPTHVKPIHVTATFNTMVTGLTAADITATNATVSNVSPVSGSSMVFTFDLTPTLNRATVTAFIIANAVTDQAGTGNSQSATFSIAVRLLQPIFAVGTDAGGGPEVKVYDSQTGALKFDFNAYNTAFRGGVRVAVGDVNNDGVLDIITAPGPGGGPLVNVFSGIDLAMLLSFNAYDLAFRKGLFVAAGDVNGDGHAEIITAPDAGGGPLIKVFNGSDASLLVAFNAYDPALLTGVHVAAGDLNGDGKAEIITAPGQGGGPLVKAFDGTGALLLAFNAYNPTFSGGVFVAAGDVNGDGKADIITGANGAPHVEVFNSANGSLLLSYFAFDSTSTSGVRVAATDMNADGKADIVAGAGPGGLPEVRIQDALTLAMLDDFFAYDPLFSGGVFVGGV